VINTGFSSLRIYLVVVKKGPRTGMHFKTVSKQRFTHKLKSPFHVRNLTLK
jgi:hypothetical protein